MEIVRKWLVKEMPNLERAQKITYERHFLYAQEGTEIRIQHYFDKYEMERKVLTTKYSSENQVISISPAEFDYIKTICTKSIFRDGYILESKPVIELKVYHDLYEGLIRAEVDFKTEAAAKEFETPDWFGIEITESELGKDRNLIQLDREMFLDTLDSLTKN